MCRRRLVVGVVVTTGIVLGSFAFVIVPAAAQTANTWVPSTATTSSLAGILPSTTTTIPTTLGTTTTTTPPPLLGGGPATTAPAQSTGFFDIGGHIRDAINGWLGDLVASALSASLGLVGHAVGSTPRVTDQARVQQLWTITATIAGTLAVLFAIAGATIVMSYETLQSQYSAKQIAPRLVLAMVMADASMLIVSNAIDLANAVSQSVLAAVVVTGQSLSGAIGGVTNSAVLSNGIVLVVIGGVIAVMGFFVAATFLVRLALMVVLTVAAPIMVLTYALPQTEGIAKLWWRALSACLGVQVAQSVVLSVAVAVFLTPGGAGFDIGGDVVNLLVIASLLWLLLQIPAWALRNVTSGHHSVTVRMVRDYSVLRVLRGRP